jgi:gliding motility-associated-like protein
MIMLYASLLPAQPKPCGAKPDMTTTCIEACVICDIDGYTGINDDPERGQAPPGFCTGTIHHMQWIAFIAGSQDLTITVTPSGCRLGSGLEVGIYESLNCSSFRLVSNCNGGILPGQTGVFNNTTPLVVGQYYYFVMDGNGNDVCNYTIRVTKGSAKVPPLAATGAIQGPAETCQGDSVQFAVPALNGANFYQWYLNGRPVATGREVKIAFPDTGLQQLSATAFNVCDTSDAAFFTVLVHADKNTLLEEQICEGTCVTIANTKICDPGIYTFRFQTSKGCDSVVQVNVSRKFTVSSFLDVYICSTDSLLVGDTWYRPPGSYVEVQPSSSRCDSLINLTLRAVICEITGNARGEPVLCNGGSTGALIFKVINGTPPFMYSWERLGGSPSGSGNLDTLEAEIRVDNLPAGSYLVTIRDTFGNDAVFQTVITEPPRLSLQLEPSGYKGFNIACKGGNTGTLLARPAGGTPPYVYFWNNGAEQPAIGALTAGRYAVKVSDANDCMVDRETILTEPPSLAFEAVFIHPGCDGPNTGSISVLNARGGVGPYRYTLSGGDFQESTIFPGLGDGSYTVRLKDANGCLADTTSRLIAAAIPRVILAAGYQLRLGYALKLEAFVNLVPKTVKWAPEDGLSCTNCLVPEASPVKNMVYTLSVTSADGCTTADSVAVTLVKYRPFFAPNVFSPNGDGTNDAFTIFGGPALRRMRALRVYSRWGELIFERLDFPANDPSLGWDGRYRGAPLQEGLFVWSAELEYVDGVVEVAKGEVSIIK